MRGTHPDGHTRPAATLLRLGLEFDTSVETMRLLATGLCDRGNEETQAQGVSKEKAVGRRVDVDQDVESLNRAATGGNLKMF